MSEAVDRTMTLLCALVAGVPVGTNLGRLLAARGALFPGLGACGLSARAIRRD